MKVNQPYKLINADACVKEELTFPTLLLDSADI